MYTTNPEYVGLHVYNSQTPLQAVCSSPNSPTRKIHDHYLETDYKRHTNTADFLTIHHRFSFKLKQISKHMWSKNVVKYPLSIEKFLKF